MVGRKRKSRKKKRRSGGARFLLTASLLIAAVAGGAAWLVLSPFGSAEETFVEVPAGSSSARIGQKLEAAGVVRSRYAFELLRLCKRGTLRAGEYRFDHPAPATEVYARIARGDVFTKSVTIPEGANLFDVASRLEQAGLGARKDFLDAAAGQTALVADLDPGARSLEGYLFPDTYYLARKATPAEICATMVRRFRVVAGQLGLTGNVHAAVTLASLVERETAVDTERPLVASVFQNRLAKGMPLMTDPAVIYGLELEGRWRGVIYRTDLKFDTAYNTYLHKGLPPSPIANPGARSLRAALEPAKTDFLYFVAAGANPQGHSLFSRTLDEQNRNVAGYRSAAKRAGGR
ncbi:MAG: endolytic transglycosylase MltG [Terracidiphilus sp.]|nr:endolytic transglycosylase MltG [Terracidiphilus sp.]